MRLRAQATEREALARRIAAQTGGQKGGLWKPRERKVEEPVVYAKAYELEISDLGHTKADCAPCAL